MKERQGLAGERYGRDKVGSDRGLQFLVRGLRERSDGNDASIVDQDVEPAPLPVHGIHESRTVFRFGHVGFEGVMRLPGSLAKVALSASGRRPAMIRLTPRFAASMASLWPIRSPLP